MEDRINELKKLITVLEEDSPLRKQLEEALAAELERKATEAASQASTEETTTDTPPKEEQPAPDTESNDEAEAPKDNENNEEESTTSRKKSSNLFDGIDTIVEKLDDLMEDEEFITASAGFVLGAAAVGLCVLGLNVLKK